MPLSASHVLQLVGFSVLLSSGQMLFKYAAITSPVLNSFHGFLSLALNPWFIVAVILYAVATILWILILQQVPLSMAYPFVALGFVLVPLGAHYFLHETLNFYYLIGVLFVVLGLGFILRMAAA